MKSSASRAKTPAELLQFEDIRPALLTAAGVSDKAEGHMQPEDKVEAIQGLIAHFLEPAGSAFVEELVFRFLLTRGDALGGSMRNIGGAMAQRKLTQAIIAILSLARIPFAWLHAPSKTWLPVTNNDIDMDHLCGLSWVREGQHRTIIYNLKVPFIGSNVDLYMLRYSPRGLEKDAHTSPSLYIALGELKGGIDPAGADEHWKTARTALMRIRQSFHANGLSPHTFFIGAAIAKRMADEICTQLEDGTLTNAANLTSPDQVASLCRWLTSL